MKKKIRFLLLTCSALMMLCTGTNAYAHEMYWTKTGSTLTIITASSSTKKIKGANIYLKPNPNNPTTYMYQTTISHEFGHVLCLGHSHEANYNPANVTTDPSIMSYTYQALQISYLPQNHELNDVNSMYGY